MTACNCKKIDLIGQKFGRLTVLKEAPKPQGLKYKVQRCWLCVCECGENIVVRMGNLRNGNSTGCRACRNISHGKSGTKEYYSWQSMKDRCNNPSNEQYADYGGRGITVCKRWLNSFENFYADMGPRPNGKTLDRYPDNDSDYGPGNCRWGTYYEQAINKRIQKSNTSGIVGVNWHKKIGKWQARIERFGRSYFLGSYKDFFEACCARKSAEQERYS